MDPGHQQLMKSQEEQGKEREELTKAMQQNAAAVKDILTEATPEEKVAASRKQDTIGFVNIYWLIDSFTHPLIH